MLKEDRSTLRIPETIKDPKYNQKFGEDICQMMFDLCNKDLNFYEQSVKDFIDLSREFIQLQVELEDTGKQHFSSHSEVNQEIYGNQEVMQKRYLKGIFLSQAFWINQHKTMNFFVDDFCPNQNPKGKILEVPLGTGIFTYEFMKRNPNWNIKGVDISESAVDFSKNLLNIRNLDHQGSVNLATKDVFHLSEENKFEKIICGCLLENFENPRDLLVKLKNLLAENGKLFLTSTAWAAGIDHIYLYKSVQEIREMLEEYFRIEKEIVLSIFPGRDPEKEKTATNYACILTNKKT